MSETGMKTGDKSSGEVTIRAMQMTAWNGALPPPDMAKAYEELSPGAFARLLSMAEEEAKSRRALSEKSQDAYVASVKRGLSFAFILTMSAFVGAVACVALGCEKAAIAFVGATVVNLAATFIGRKTGN